MLVQMQTILRGDASARSFDRAVDSSSGRAMATPVDLRKVLRLYISKCRRFEEFKSENRGVKKSDSGMVALLRAASAVTLDFPMILPRWVPAHTSVESRQFVQLRKHTPFSSFLSLKLRPTSAETPHSAPPHEPTIVTHSRLPGSPAGFLRLPDGQRIG